MYVTQFFFLLEKSLSHRHRDYRGLKKIITTIRHAQQGLEAKDSPSPSEIELNVAQPRPSDLQSDLRPSFDVPRPSSSFSIIPPLDILDNTPSSPNLQEEAETSNFTRAKTMLSRRKQSTRGRKPTLIQQGFASLRRTRGRSLSSRRAFPTCSI